RGLRAPRELAARDRPAVAALLPLRGLGERLDGEAVTGHAWILHVADAHFPPAEGEGEGNPFVQVHGGPWDRELEPELLARRSRSRRPCRHLEDGGTPPEALPIRP